MTRSRLWKPLRGISAGTLLGVLLLVPAMNPPQAAGCYNQTVRDAAFRYPRDMHRLAVVAGREDPEGNAVYSRLEQWLHTSGRGLNLELSLVDPEDPEVSWEELGVPSAPPSWPVVVLAGGNSNWRSRPSFLIDHWEPEPSAADLEVLASSPAREEIRSEAARRLAVLVYVPASDSGSGALEVLESVARRWSAEEPLGVGLVQVDRKDQRERLLLAFMGAADAGPGLAAVVFGPGKMSVPLRGGEITAERLDRLIDPLSGDCTCLQSPYALGVDIPMKWDETHDRAVVALRGEELQTASASGSGRVLKAAAGTLGGLVLLVGLATAWIMRRRLL
ncbi:MAG: hypothetical protein JXQ83_14300 [Candidatus Glassbacteria bacterium]|nr:hypothetical protein [Candidatus Glassbacteria bacterium]